MVRDVLLVAALGLLSSGCVSQTASYSVKDPAATINQRSFAVSERVDSAVLKPVARGFKRVVPGFLRQGIQNFFSNVRGVDSAVNGFLQGKPRRGFTDVGRVLVNTTLGIGGLFDPATDMGLQFQDEDFGQTLAVWGYTESAYVYLPVVGPVTVRDIPVVVLRFAVPRFVLGENYTLGVGALDVVALRSEALALTQARDAAALDPYAFTREAYYQRRKFQIFDGAPPQDEFFDEFEDEEFEEEPETNPDSGSEFVSPELAEL